MHRPCPRAEVETWASACTRQGFAIGGVFAAIVVPVMVPHSHDPRPTRTWLSGQRAGGTAEAVDHL
jgi:hypothetical protein